MQTPPVTITIGKRSNPPPIPPPGGRVVDSGLFWIVYGAPINWGFFTQPAMEIARVPKLL